MRKRLPQHARAGSAYHLAAVNVLDLLLRQGKPAEAQAAYAVARKAGIEGALEGKLAF